MLSSVFYEKSYNCHSYQLLCQVFCIVSVGELKAVRRARCHPLISNETTSDRHERTGCCGGPAVSCQALTNLFKPLTSTMEKAWKSVAIVFGQLIINIALLGWCHLFWYKLTYFV